MVALDPPPAQRRGEQRLVPASSPARVRVAPAPGAGRAGATAGRAAAHGSSGARGGATDRRVAATPPGRSGDDPARDHEEQAVGTVN